MKSPPLTVGFGNPLAIGLDARHSVDVVDGEQRTVGEQELNVEALVGDRLLPRLLPCRSSNPQQRAVNGDFVVGVG